MCEGLKIKYYRGSESDVLIRVLNAHVLTESNVIVELTGDCPLIDVNLVDNIILKYLNNDFDYVSNSHIRSYPDGFDVQVFPFKLSIIPSSNFISSKYSLTNFTLLYSIF